MHTEQPAVGAPVQPSVRPLVDRLRDAAQGVALGADGMGWSPDPELMREAADEIERAWAARDAAVADLEAHAEAEVRRAVAEERAEIERLRQLVQMFAGRVFRLAYEMPPPNEYTPRFVILAHAAQVEMLNGTGGPN